MPFCVALSRLCRSPCPSASQAGDVPQPETPEAQSHPGQDFCPPHPEGMVVCVCVGGVLTGEQQKAPRRERGLEKKETNRASRLPTANALCKNQIFPETGPLSKYFLKDLCLRGETVVARELIFL